MVVVVVIVVFVVMVVETHDFAENYPQERKEMYQSPHGFHNLSHSMDRIPLHASIVLLTNENAAEKNPKP